MITVTYLSLYQMAAFPRPISHTPYGHMVQNHVRAFNIRDPLRFPGVDVVLFRSCPLPPMARLKEIGRLSLSHWALLGEIDHKIRTSSTSPILTW
jgi:hypothetical protein